MSDNNSQWLTFGGIDPADALAEVGARFTVLEVNGAGVFGKRVHTVDRAGGDGARRVSGDLLERRITVRYEMDTRSPMNHDSLVRQHEAEALLNQLFHANALAELRLSFRDGYFMAEVDDITVNRRLAHYQTGTITFVCPSPFLWGETRTVGRGSGNRVEVNSNYFVEPVILWRTRIGYGAPHIEVDGKRLTVDTQVGEGQQIRIDSARKEVRIGGVLEVEHIHGTFPRLFDGSVVTIVPGGTDLEFQYQERWI